jgi:hypothetical protein
VIFPEERVLVGVISRKRDMDVLKTERWYRIPQAQFPRGVHTEVVAFFLSSTVAKPDPAGIHYYGRKPGIELMYRRDILPNEPNHPRADEVYYQLHFKDIHPRIPPITNPTRRPITFIKTTWDRFEAAHVIADLYSEDDMFVDRVLYALQDRIDVHPARLWQADRQQDSAAPGLRIPCRFGEVAVSTEPNDGVYLLERDKNSDEILHEIMAAIDRMGGPIMMSLPGE